MLVLSRPHLRTSRRWLNNEQSAADSAYFMANVQFPGIDEDLTAPNHPWIYYGVSRDMFAPCSSSLTAQTTGLLRRCARRAHANPIPRPRLRRDRLQRYGRLSSQPRRPADRAPPQA